MLNDAFALGYLSRVVDAIQSPCPTFEGGVESGS